jgi:hypothetical protein
LRVWRNQWGRAISLLRPPGLPRQIFVDLQICHLNNQPGDDRDDNLRACCGWCHCNLDLPLHKQTRAARKDRARPLLARLASGATALEEHPGPRHKEIVKRSSLRMDRSALGRAFGEIGLDGEIVVDGLRQILAGAEVAFGGLDGGMAEQELDLFEVAAGEAAELGAGAAQVVGRESGFAEAFAVFADDVPDGSVATIHFLRLLRVARVGKALITRCRAENSFASECSAVQLCNTSAQAAPAELRNRDTPQQTPRLAASLRAPT